MKHLTLIVAHRAKALVFNVSDQKKLTLKEHWDHADGQSHNSEFTTGQPGRSYDSNSQHRHSYEPPHTIDEQLNEQWSRQIVHHMKTLSDNHSTDEFVIFASSKLLGEIRKHLSGSLGKKVVASMDKDLSHASNQEVETQWSKFLDTKAGWELFPPQ